MWSPKISPPFRLNKYLTQINKAWFGHFYAQKFHYFRSRYQKAAPACTSEVLFFPQLLFGHIKLSDLECRNRKLSAHDCTDHIKRPFSFDNYHETRNINTSPPCCSTQATIVDRYSIIPHTQHTYRISAKTTWQL